MSRRVARIKSLTTSVDRGVEKLEHSKLLVAM